MCCSNVGEVDDDWQTNNRHLKIAHGCLCAPVETVYSILRILVKNAKNTVTIAI